MAKNIDFMGATFPDVPSIRLPQHEGGLVSFTDVTDTTAIASDVASGKYFYTADGTKTIGTASGGITPSGTYSITSNGTYDVTQYASANVNVSGGGGITIKTLTKAITTSSDVNIEFTGLEAEPKAFYIEQTTNISLTSTNANRYVTGVFYDGENISLTSCALTARTNASSNHLQTGISWNYSNGTLTIRNSTSTSVGYFRTGVTYKLIYMY